MQGLKSQVKQFLKEHGITTIQLDNGSEVKLQQAKTSQLIQKASTIKGFVPKKRGRKRKKRTTKKHTEKNKTTKKAGEKE